MASVTHVTHVTCTRRIHVGQRRIDTARSGKILGLAIFNLPLTFLQTALQPHSDRDRTLLFKKTANLLPTWTYSLHI